LDGRAVKREMLWHTKITNKLRQRVSDVVTINLLDGVGNHEAALVGVQLASNVAPQ